MHNMRKEILNAAQIADTIRQRLKEPKLRIGVFSNPAGWHATVYAAPLVAAELQKKVDQVSDQLRELYELRS